MNTLVTGGGGFLGRFIVEQLVARGDRVRSFGRGAYPELEAMGVEVVRGDIRNRDAVISACEAMDCIFHSAAIAGIWGRWETFHGTNVAGTKNVLAGCREHGVKRLVFTSSPSVTFDGREQCGIDESVPYPSRWSAHYPHTKAIAEQAVLEASGDEMQTIALRPHLIWGPRDNHLIPRLIDRARRGRLRRVGDGTNLVDMIYVENAATAHLQAADAMASASPDSRSASPGSPGAGTLAGKAYFLSQGEPVNCWQWIDQILALADLPPVKKTISLNAAWKVGAVCEGLYRLLRLSGEPPMTRFLAAQLGTSHWFDISAARRDFGYQPRISTVEGMRRLGDWLNSDS